MKTNPGNQTSGIFYPVFYRRFTELYFLILVPSKKYNLKFEYECD